MYPVAFSVKLSYRTSEVYSECHESRSPSQRLHYSKLKSPTQAFQYGQLISNV